MNLRKTEIFNLSGFSDQTVRSQAVWKWLINPFMQMDYSIFTLQTGPFSISGVSGLFVFLLLFFLLLFFVVVVVFFCCCFFVCLFVCLFFVVFFVFFFVFCCFFFLFFVVVFFGGGVVFFIITMFYRIPLFNANSVDPQTPRYVCQCPFYGALSVNGLTGKY